MKIVAPVRLLSCTYNGWSSTYALEYCATRSAADIGMLAKQFKVGTPLVIEGKHMVVRDSTVTVNSESPSEVRVEVTAIDFGSLLSGAFNPSPAAPGVTVSVTQSRPAPRLALPGGRRILA
jgi:hypothetical protein